MLKKQLRMRDSKGALQARLRLDGRDHFINRLGRFDDPVAQARGQAICAEIWGDAQQGGFGSFSELIPPLSGVTRSRLARCPLVTGRGEKAWI
tara:strand:+ start:2919 stop:3197 length:279 start_codon:yes stop_codon:yes gene_type:complete